MEVTKVFMPVIFDGKTALYNVDMIWDGDRPIAVFSWTRGDAGRDTPAVTVPLNPNFLHQIPG